MNEFTHTPETPPTQTKRGRALHCEEGLHFPQTYILLHGK